MVAVYMSHINIIFENNLAASAVHATEIDMTRRFAVDGVKMRNVYFSGGIPVPWLINEMSNINRTKRIFCSCFE